MILIGPSVIAIVRIDRECGMTKINKDEINIDKCLLVDVVSVG